MVTYDVNEAKDAIIGLLQGMGHDPYGLIIIDLDAEKGDDQWELEGEFQVGFMGEVATFKCKYYPKTKSASRLTVTGSKGKR